MKLLQQTTVILLFLLSLQIIFSQENKVFEMSASKILMGTEFSITANSTDIDKCKKAMYYALKEVERIDFLIGIEHDSSEITKINENAGTTPVKVSSETFELIKRSIAYSEKYAGIFDISIGPISELWGFNSNPPKNDNPQKSSIDSLIKYVDFRRIILNENDTSVFLPEAPMKLDMGGIGKGYAIDRAVLIMKKNGIGSFIINGGGDIYISGFKFENEKWSVGIKDPRNENKLFAKLEANDIAIGTSGDYERYRIVDGIRYHHIFDVSTGYPAMLTRSATSFASTAEEAVILSKYIFILGYDKFSVISKEKNIDGVLIDADGRIKYDNELTNKYGFVLLK